MHLLLCDANKVIMHRVFYAIFQKLFFPELQGRNNRHMCCEHPSEGIRTPGSAAVGGRMRQNIHAAIQRDRETLVVGWMRKDRLAQAMSFRTMALTIGTGI